MRGLGGFARSSWDEVNEIVAAANVYTIKKHGPDRVIGFSPIPAMSMVSYAAGSRYLSLIGGVCMSFYDWYCDLPPSSPQIWGEQTDVPESADWYNSNFIIAWGSNVPQTRTPDAHFFTEVRYKGTKTVAVTPDYSEVAKLSDLWLHPKQGTDAALAMAMGHVILREFYFDRRAQRLLRRLRPPLHRPADAGALKEQRCRAANRDGARPLPARLRFRRTSSARRTTRSGRPSPSTRAANWRCPTGAIGFRWGPDGRPDQGSGTSRRRTRGRAAKSSSRCRCSRAQAAEPRGRLPVFRRHRPRALHNGRAGNDVLVRTVPVKRSRWPNGAEALVATVFDLQAANYGIARASRRAPPRYDDDAPYTPAWQERITGVPREQVIAVARQFADNAEKTHGRSMVIIGAAMNHWYHMRHELPRRHQHADAVRLRRPERRRLGALRGPGEAAPADRLDGARLRARLDPPAAPAEQHQLLLRAHRPVALREDRRRRGALAARRPQAPSAAA